MERYNISYLDRAQASQAPKVARWPSAVPTRHRSIIPVVAAIALHIAAGGVLLAIGRAGVTAKVPEERTVGWVFAATRPEPAAPPAIPEPPAPATTPEPPKPASPPTPAADLPPPDEAPPAPEPAAPRETFTQPEAPLPANEPKPGRLPPIKRPPARTTPSRAGPMPAPHTVEPPAATQPRPETQTPAPSAAEPLIPADWQRSLATWLARHKTYPDEARRRGVEGNVILRFTVDRSGHVRDVALVRSAGSAMLDEAAEAMLRDSALPPFTGGMSQDVVTVTVQIRYGLTN